MALLKRIKRNVPEPGSNVEIEIMLGSKCPKALPPIKIIPNQQGGPCYANWPRSIYGPIIETGIQHIA